jgi:hypothetical protein
MRANPEDQEQIVCSTPLSPSRIYYTTRTHNTHTHTNTHTSACASCTSLYVPMPGSPPADLLTPLPAGCEWICVCFFLSFAKRDGDYTWAARILSCMPIDRWPMGKEGRGKTGLWGRREDWPPSRTYKVSPGTIVALASSFDWHPFLHDSSAGQRRDSMILRQGLGFRV